MILVLLPAFLLTAAVFVVGTFFLSGFVFECGAAQLRQLARLGAILLVVLPPLYFGVYMLASPKSPGDPAVTPAAASIPAVWLAVVLAAILGGFLLAGRRARRREASSR